MSGYFANLSRAFATDSISVLCLLRDRSPRVRCRWLRVIFEVSWPEEYVVQWFREKDSYAKQRKSNLKSFRVSEDPTSLS